MSEILIIGLVVIAAGLVTTIMKLRAQLAHAETTAAALRQQLQQTSQDCLQKTAVSRLLSCAAYDALLVLDHDSRILAMNPRAEAVLQTRSGSGQLLADVVHAPELDSVLHGARDNDGEPFEEQLTIHERSYRVRAQMVRQNSDTYIALALQDATEIVRLNRARRDMVANISHELRTPIANIRLIIDSLFHSQDKPKRKDLKAIGRETDNLLWLVQGMGDLAMIESGQAIVRMFDVPLVELVNEAIENVRDQGDAKDLSIVNHVPQKMQVLCDRDLAKRVLVNLIHNAIKWSPKGEAITLNAVNGADEVTVSVLDNGPGVPDNQTERIFERFYQVDASRSGHEGTGLGLAICKHIVEAHGGRIWAEGNGQGSGGRFLFTLLSAEEHGGN